MRKILLTACLSVSLIFIKTFVFALDLTQYSRPNLEKGQVFLDCSLGPNYSSSELDYEDLTSTSSYKYSQNLYSINASVIYGLDEMSEIGISLIYVLPYRYSRLNLKNLSDYASYEFKESLSTRISFRYRPESMLELYVDANLNLPQDYLSLYLGREAVKTSSGYSGSIGIRKIW